MFVGCIRFVSFFSHVTLEFTISYYCYVPLQYCRVFGTVVGYLGPW
jgi:hypothetical protein